MLRRRFFVFMKDSRMAKQPEAKIVTSILAEIKKKFPTSMRAYKAADRYAKGIPDIWVHGCSKLGSPLWLALEVKTESGEQSRIQEHEEKKLNATLRKSLVEKKRSGYYLVRSKAEAMRIVNLAYHEGFRVT